MARKKKDKMATDGLGPAELKRIRSAVRQVWSWSTPYRLAKKRAHIKDGFYRCENPECKHRKNERHARVAVDHIDAVGPVQGPRYIKRMFVPSKRLQVICKKSHDKKTREERKAAGQASLPDFY